MTSWASEVEQLERRIDELEEALRYLYMWISPAQLNEDEDTALVEARRICWEALQMARCEFEPETFWLNLTEALTCDCPKCGDGCAETLKLLSPMMRLKQRQALLLLELQALKDGTMPRPGGRTRWTPQARECAEELRAEVKALNRRGPDADWEWPEKADAVLVGDRLLRPQTSLLSETGYEESSGTFPTSGLAWATGSLTAFSTHVSSECRSADGECSSSEPSLTEILEPPLSVPARYSLSARAASGILRRAEKRGRTLPSHLSAALKAVARTTTTDREAG